MQPRLRDCVRDFELNIFEGDMGSIVCTVQAAIPTTAGDSQNNGV
jgi:hypothetical protein